MKGWKQIKEGKRRALVLIDRFLFCSQIPADLYTLAGVLSHLLFHLLFRKPVSFLVPHSFPRTRDLKDYQNP